MLPEDAVAAVVLVQRGVRLVGLRGTRRVATGLATASNQDGFLAAVGPRLLVLAMAGRPGVAGRGLPIECGFIDRVTG